MCYNCGCGIPDDPMGKGRLSEGGSSLTETDFKKVAKDWETDLTSVKKETYKLLKKEFEKDS